ncbi:hypothetical protein H072_3983 [Dactylellina haptotyla CBS 200.50]|uniref:DUF8004 domain-containing protein n=1 Tax=Dactylellina haptotyla (strain CBS 200.50) TaxID=1284197 RepID=S8BRJ6_DACHA|nr:hypothetical protein H072_3983 [Dactylellina haptotyla CBS 200.50]
MAQRSARARSKLDKISSGGIAKFGHGGLATPATSTGSPSLSSFSSRSFGRSSSNQKSVFRSFIDSKSDKIRGTLADKISPVATKPRLELDVESAPTLKRWEGGGRHCSTWTGLSRRDPELWFPDGDTLVYLSDKFSKSKEDQPFKQPSFRIRSSVLRATNSPFLIGSLYDYDDLPQSPTSISSSMMSADNDIHSVPSQSSRDLEGIAHELHFPAPRSNDRAAIYRHHATTRNFFAVLFNKSLVGATFGQTLLDLAERMELYMPPGHDNVGDLLKYLTRKEFDDVRNMPDLAAGMLIFSEKYRLADLYRESFVHCVGMMNRLELSVDYQEISSITRAHLDRANLNIQVRTDRCDNLLVHGQFSFNEVWPHMSAGYPPARHAFDRFQKFLAKHYQNRFGSWPPAGEKFGRLLYQQLQRDFNALYDFLVDKDAMWEPVAPSSSSASTSSHQRATGSHRLINPYKQEFRADDNSLQFTDIIISFDRNNKYPHIPHPYPLVPEVKTSTTIRSNKQSNFFGKRNANADKTMEKENALALIQATNLDALYTSPNNSLVAAYQLMEKTGPAIEIDPHDARKGRWLLIYAVLQTLATITVDAPGLKWTDNVDYFLCAPTKGVPPWEQQPQSSRSGEEEDYCQYRAHCWIVPYQWNSQASAKSLQDMRVTESQLALTRPVTDEDIFPERAELAASPTPENNDYMDGRPSKRRTPVASFASSGYVPINLGRTSLQSRNSRTSLHSTHSHTAYRSGIEDLGIGPGILEKDDFEPGALESLNVLAMNNPSGAILSSVTPAIASSTASPQNISATSGANRHHNSISSIPHVPYEYDDGGSSDDADGEDNDVEMDEEHDPGNFLMAGNPRASNMSNATRSSRESGAAGMYAPWGGVDVTTR